eukprot:c5721_g1_i1.p1 GENE.c5721_g1_i1~~c5721_g1_i1.p1  ORF type:complete len:139 (-),score=61.95 c5721_g1_i1:69-446(-)
MLPFFRQKPKQSPSPIKSIQEDVQQKNVAEKIDEQKKPESFGDDTRMSQISFESTTELEIFEQFRENTLKCAKWVDNTHPRARIPKQPRFKQPDTKPTLPTFRPSDYPTWVATMRNQVKKYEKET